MTYHKWQLVLSDLLSREDKSLLWRRDPFLLLNSLLDPLDLVSGLDVDLDLLASQSLHLDQHLLSLTPESESHCNKARESSRKQHHLVRL